MRPSLVFMSAAALVACIGSNNTGTTRVTSGQGGTVTGTGVTGGSTPATDMQGTGREPLPAARRVAEPAASDAGPPATP